uniref:Uncharacterized protein n=1 Tax=Tanacetum cinerariifolium TaxID=118510 RepID=A0A6L2MUY7_TANCI|nr:hypothetical protein [Tanacetum cinerariifolium]
MISLGQKNTLVEYMILSGADNHSPMLDKDMTNKYAELSAAEKIQADCDMKATNIILQGDDLIACLNKAMDFLTAPKRPRNASWYKEKAMLAKAREAGQVLDEEQLAFLTDPRVLV